MLTEQDLLKKKKQIETATAELSELKGEEKALLKQLKENWDCSSLVEAKKLIVSLDKMVKELTDKVDVASAELEAKYLKAEEE
jgi:hypothetical protein